MEWIFEGIGTEMISLVIGAFIGGGVGYKIGIKKNVKQKQRSGDNSTNIQIGGDYNGK